MMKQSPGEGHIVFQCQWAERKENSCTMYSSLFITSFCHWKSDTGSGCGDRL